MKNKIYILMVLVGLVACTETITLDIPEGKKRLVVDGRIEKMKETGETIVQVKLTTTAPYFENAPTPRVSEANVTIEVENAETYALTESEDGIYITDEIEAEIGATYRLHVIWNNEAYIAETTLMPVTPILSIYQIYQEESLFDDAGIKLAMDFQDSANEPNFYLFEQYRNDTLLLLPSGGNQFQTVISDEFFDGQLIEEYVPGNDFSFLPNDDGRLRMIALNKEAYDFYRLLYEKTAEVPTGLGATPPIPIKGNITNTDTPQNYGLGYFLAAEVSQQEITIIGE